MQFKKATKKKLKAKVALVGPSGAGKTFTAMKIAKGLGQSIAVIDTERGSASKYAGDVVDFDVLELDSFAPLTYVKAIEAAHGYDVLIVDSLSHAWVGKDGALEQVDRRGGRFQAWKEVTPMQQQLVDAILAYPGHIIVTMRSKTTYEVEKDDRGRTSVRKLGLAPVQRDGMEYEFDLMGELDDRHNMRVTKSRCPKLADQVIAKPDEAVARVLCEWLTDGEDAPVQARQVAPEPTDIVDEIDAIGAAFGSGELDYPQARERIHAMKPRLMKLPSKEERDRALAAVAQVVEVAKVPAEKAEAAALEWINRPLADGGEAA